MTWYKKASKNNLEIGDNNPIKEKLQQAVDSYVQKCERVQPAYYVNPRYQRYDFDPNNPQHVEKELGKDYDKSFEIKNGNHPSFLKCKGSASGLAEYLKKLGFKARVVAGWYGHADRDYSTGKSPGLYDATPPQNFGTNAEEHWWVEAEGYYIDTSSAQFHPRNPNKQFEYTIKEKEAAIESQDYYPVRRFPLGRAAPLPDNVRKMVQKIISLKRFQTGRSSNYGDLQSLNEWIGINAKRYGLSEEQASDIQNSIRAASSEDFYFADERKMSRLFGEAFDEIPEDSKLIREDKKAKPFKLQHIKPNSMGIVRISRLGISLSSTINMKYDDRFENLKRVIKNAWSLPETLSFSTSKYETTNNYGSVFFTAYCEVKMNGENPGNPFDMYFSGRLNPEQMDSIRTVFMAMKAAGYKLDFF